MTIHEEEVEAAAKAFHDSKPQFSHARLGFKTFTWDEAHPDWKEEARRLMHFALLAAAKVRGAREWDARADMTAADHEALVKRLRDWQSTCHSDGFPSQTTNYLIHEAATALESLGARPQTITVPKPTPDQAEYLERIAAGQKYDPETVVGGPARPQAVTEAIDACAQLRDQSDLDLPPSWEPLFVEGYRHGCDECVSHIQNLAAVPPRASDTRPDLADLNYLRKPFPAPPPTSQWQTMVEAGTAMWRHAITTANNICMMRADELNDDDAGPEVVGAVSDAAAEIRRWLNQDDAYIRSALATILNLPAPPTEQDKP